MCCCYEGFKHMMHTFALQSLSALIICDDKIVYKHHAFEHMITSFKKDVFGENLTFVYCYCFNLEFFFRGDTEPKNKKNKVCFADILQLRCVESLHG